MTDTDDGLVLTWEEALAIYGDHRSVPSNVVFNIQEFERLQWVELYKEEEGEKERRDKSKAISNYVRDNVGVEVTAVQLSEIGECAVGTANKFISDYRSLFRKVRRGVYVICSREELEELDK